MNQSKTIYETFFGDYIGKKVMVFEDGYYYCGEYITGRSYLGVLRRVSLNKGKLCLHIDDDLITVFEDTLISIIE